ncbi:hypothetical protein ACJX0J_021116 [Zea mays]
MDLSHLFSSANEFFAFKMIHVNSLVRNTAIAIILISSNQYMFLLRTVHLYDHLKHYFAFEYRLKSMDKCNYSGTGGIF